MQYKFDGKEIKALEQCRVVAEENGYNLYVHLFSVDLEDFSNEQVLEMSEIEDSKHAMNVIRECNHMSDDEEFEDLAEYLVDYCIESLTGYTFRITIENKLNYKRHSVEWSDVEIVYYNDELREALRTNWLSGRHTFPQQPDTLYVPYRSGIVVSCFGRHIEKMFNTEPITSNVTF